jgi:3-oxoacyl-(acyl-carrier-protein) synthase
LTDAKVTADEKLALIFAVANGGVIYTKRFYSDIVNTGADTASPLLFPETVFNAAASPLAAIIGLTATTYTVVGDGTIGLTAIKMAEDLLENREFEYCLIVAAEEADWLLCDAYQKWRLLRSGPPLEVFQGKSRGTILSEGAGAVLLGRRGPIRLEATVAGAHFTKRSEAPGALAQALTKIGAPMDAIVISSANGTFIDAAEMAAVRHVAPKAVLYSPKEALGEGVAASALWQVIVARQCLSTGRIPCPQYSPSDRTPQATSVKSDTIREITVLSCGLSQQGGATRLVLES